MDDLNFSKRIKSLKPVEPDPQFRMQLHLDLYEKYSQTQAFEKRRFQYRRWVPWSVAVAASFLVVFFNLNLNSAVRVETDQGGLALEQTDSGWRRLASRDRSQASSFYISPGTQSKIFHPNATVLASDDCRIDFKDNKTINISSGKTVLEPVSPIVVKFPGFKCQVNGKILVDLVSEKPQLLVHQGQVVLRDSYGRQIVIKKGQDFDLRYQNSLVQMRPQSAKKILGFFKEGQVIHHLLSENDLAKTQELHDRLILAQRLSQEADLVKILNLLPQLKGVTKQAGWNYIKSQSFAKLLEAQNLAKNQQLSQITVRDERLNRVYDITRLDSNLFRVEVSGNLPRILSAQEVMDILPAHVVASLPSEWGIEVSR